MSATILRLEPQSAAGPPTGLARHLTGHHARGPTPGGIAVRMQSEAAVRAFVRKLSRQCPTSDAGIDDPWAQVEDILALVPTLASSIPELDDIAHAVLKTVLGCRRGYVSTGLDLASCAVEIVALGRAFRMRLHDQSESRVITAILEPAAARRIDDATVSR